jgi:hypothetical protein
MQVEKLEEKPAGMLVEPLQEMEEKSQKDHSLLYRFYHVMFIFVMGVNDTTMHRNITVESRKGAFCLLVALLLLSLAAVQVSALIQTDIIYTMDDTYVNNSAGTTNYDGQSLKAGKTGSETLETWFRFDLSDPSGYYVVDAVLYTYVYSATNSKSYDLRNSSNVDWTETNLTWNNKPSYGGSVAQNTIGASGWFSWTITGTYSDFFSSGESYAAYALTETGAATAWVVIEDKEDSQSTGNVPYLNLTMMIPEVYLLSPADPYNTYDTSITFQYNIDFYSFKHISWRPQLDS